MAGEETPAPLGFDVRIAWQRNDPRIEADAIEIWTRLGILPEDVTPEDRAKELVAAAYSGERLAAVCTAVIEPINFLRARFLVMRSMTHPDFRRTNAQIALALPAKAALEAWAKANPADNVAGVIGFVEPGAWGAFAQLPVAPVWAWTLVGYTKNGHQIRAAWFDHYRIET